MSSSNAVAPLVTVGLAVYNGERFVAQAIESILEQTFSDFVVLISDNASSDRTGEICLRYARLDPRISYRRNDTNIGMPGNYNLLFRQCRSRYFRWATADDYSAPDMLEDAVATMEADESLALCYPRAFMVDESGRELGRWQDELHLVQDDPVARFRTVVSRIGRVHHHLGLMRSSHVRTTMLLKAHPGSDMGFIGEMSLRGKFFQIQKLQFYRRMHEDSSSFRPSDMEHQARRYLAANDRPKGFTRWRVHWTYWQGVGRAPIPPADKARAWQFLAKHAWSERGWLKDELIHVRPWKA